MYWSPDGQFGLLFADDVWLIQTTMSTPKWERLVKRKTHGERLYVENPAVIWSSQDQSLFIMDDSLYYIDARLSSAKVLFEKIHNAAWRWSPTGQAFLCIETQEFEHYIYVVDTTGSVTQLATTNFLAPPDLSSDETLLAYMKDGAVIQPLNRGEVQPIRPTSNGYSSRIGGEVRWANDSDWLLIFDDLEYTGGYYRYLGVTSAHNPVLRELGFAISPRENTLDWLPPQVSSENLPHLPKIRLPPVPSQVFYGSEWVAALAWSADGQFLTAQSKEGLSKQWDLITGKQSSEPQTSFPTPANAPSLSSLLQANALAVSPNHEWVMISSSFVGGGNMPAGIYDVKSAKLIQRLDQSGAFWSAASFSPNGHLLALSGISADVTVFETVNWGVVGTIPHYAPVIAFSPDGKQLAVTASWDVEIYNVSDLFGQ